MRSSHNVHLSNQNMKCGTRVALYKGVTCFQKRVDIPDGKKICTKKCKIFSFLS